MCSDFGATTADHQHNNNETYCRHTEQNIGVNCYAALATYPCPTPAPTPPPSYTLPPTSVDRITVHTRTATASDILDPPKSVVVYFNRSCTSMDTFAAAFKDASEQYGVVRSVQVFCQATRRRDVGHGIVVIVLFDTTEAADDLQSAITAGLDVEGVSAEPHTLSTPSDDSSSGMSTGAYIGIGVVAALAVIALVLGVRWYRRKKEGNTNSFQVNRVRF